MSRHKCDREGGPTRLVIKKLKLTIKIKKSLWAAPLAALALDQVLNSLRPPGSRFVIGK
jgi:hypothetical protein